MMWCTASLARSFSIHWLAVVMFGSRVSCEKQRHTCWIAELEPHAKWCNLKKNNMLNAKFLLHIHAEEFLTCSQSLSATTLLFSWLSRSSHLLSNTTEEAGFFPRLCSARDSQTKLLHRDHSLETTPTCSKHRDVQTALIVWFLLHHIFGVLLFV